MVPPRILIGGPRTADFLLGTRDPVVRPIDRKLGERKGAWRAGLPTDIGPDWPHELDPVLGLTLDHELGIDEARVYEVFGR